MMPGNANVWLSSPIPAVRLLPKNKMFLVADGTEVVSGGASADRPLPSSERVELPQATAIKSPKTAIILVSINYMASAITSCTSGTIRFNKPSIPALSVMVDEGHPLQDPRNSTTTVPSSKDL